MKAAGLDTYEDLGLLMTVEEMVPPAPKFYTVDIPGGNGSINLTKVLSGDTAYENRAMKFVFTMTDPSEDFEKKKTQVSNLLHGQEHDFVLSFDPEYTYRGWFSVDSYVRRGQLRQITVNIDAEPFKHKAEKTEVVDVADGATVFFASGRKMVRPRFEFTADTVMVYENVRYVMPAGTYTINDVWFKEGANKVTFVRGALESRITHKEIMEKGFTHEDLGVKPIYEWFKGLLKYSVSRIVMKGTATATTGTVTFTVTDEGGNATTHELDLGDIQIRANGDMVDTVTIFDGMARISTFEEYVDAETSETRYEERGYAIPFPMPFSLGSPIASVTHDSAAAVTYEVTEDNVERVFVEAKHSDYMEGGQLAMTHEEMGAYKVEQLIVYDTERSVVYDKDVNLVYVNYDWYDL